jgi:hypothetical protein
MGLLNIEQKAYKKLRSPYDSESGYFKSNPHVAGMATEDNMIVLNPYSSLNDQEKNSVMMNEYARLWMRNANFAPPFAVTPEQQAYFKNTPYESNASAMRQTLLSRSLTGDPSAGNMTEEQRSYVNLLRGLLSE